MTHGVALLPVLVFALLVIGVVILLARVLRGRARWAAALLLLIPVCAVLGIFSLRNSSSPRIMVREPEPVFPHSGGAVASVEADDVFASSGKVQPAPLSARASSAWNTTMDREFLADRYPSKQAAATGLTHHLLQLWRQQQAERESPPAEARICGFADTTVLAGITRVIASEWPRTRVVVAAQTAAKVHAEPVQTLPAQDEGERAIFEANINSKFSRSVAMRSEEGGTLQIDLIAGGQRQSAVAEWVQKSWMHQPSAGWIVGYSSDIAASPAEAEQQAIQSAARELTERVTNQLAQQGRHLSSTAEGLVRRIEAQIRARGVSDQFTQRFHRQYGDVFRTIVAVDASPDMVRQLTGESLVASKARQQAVWNTIWSVIGLLVLTCVVYLFLNAATKGYYAWSLRAVVLMVAVAGVLIILNFA